MGACESKENLYPPTDDGFDADAARTQAHIDNAVKKTNEISVSLQQRIDVLPTNTHSLHLGEDGSVQTSTTREGSPVTKQTLLAWKEKISELSSEIIAIEQERKAADVEHKRTVGELRRELSKARATNLAQRKVIREKEHAVARTQADIKEMVAAIALLKKQSAARKKQLVSMSGVLLKVAGEHHSKLKFARSNQKHVVFTSKLNRLFYYDALDAAPSGSSKPSSPRKGKEAVQPKMMLIRAVTTRHDAIDEHMQRPWFFVVGDKRSALFVAKDSATRDRWVRFIEQSLRNTSGAGKNGSANHTTSANSVSVRGRQLSLVPFGQQQSPINLSTTRCSQTGTAENTALRVSYPSQVRNCTLSNTGHTVRVNIDAKHHTNACRLTLNNKTYSLRQFHFHTPAEHTVDDQQHEMELHLVHESDQGELAVLAFLFSTNQTQSESLLKLSRARSRSRSRQSSRSGTRTSRASKRSKRAQTMDLRKQQSGANGGMRLNGLQTRARPKSLNLGAPPTPSMHESVVSASEISEVEASEDDLDDEVDDGDTDVEVDVDADSEAEAEAERARLNAEEDMGKFYKDYSEKRNAFLAQFWEELPTKKTAEDVPLYKALSFDSLFETAASNVVKQRDVEHVDVEMHIFEYMGSLTTPPYTEGVQWLVSKRTHFINNKQLNKLSSCWGHENNARAVQDDFGRTVCLRSQCSLHMR